MIISIKKCKCGNSNINNFTEYAGCLGYEAIICNQCGRYFDCSGYYSVDNFSQINKIRDKYGKETLIKAFQNLEKKGKIKYDELGRIFKLLPTDRKE